ncbi:MAG TPA: 50S ribosomal protein L22 [Acidobacteriota bacterium]
MEAVAKGKYIKGSPQKARLVIDLIRGKRVDEALAILRTTRKRAADPIAKVLKSAVANAEQQSPSANVDDFVVSRAYVDLGPTKLRRRMRPAPMGRAYRERRWSSHITIHVSDGSAGQED